MFSVCRRGMKKPAACIQTFGCQMNEHDSEKIAHVLSRSGYREASNPEDADLIILNTCTVREKAEQKVYSSLGRLRRLKKKGPGIIIGVGGCLAQQEGERRFERNAPPDFVFGTQNIHRLPALIEEVASGAKKCLAIDFQEENPLLGTSPRPGNGGRVKAFVTVMQGCNNYCSYCIVPYVRGEEVSRRPGEIIEEIQGLSGQGVKEIILLGQNVNSYGRGLEGNPTFADLLEGVDRIDGVERIRFTTSHPQYLSAELIHAFRDRDKRCEPVLLPVQSGSNRILRRMNRRYTREQYRARVEKLRETVEDMSITGDIIVGFPGESEEDFKDTMDLVEAVQFDGIFSFKYSSRKGTGSASFKDPLPEGLKLEKIRSLQQLQEGIT